MGQEVDMPTFSFQRQFADLVESGKKKQTIRKYRKRTPKAGQTAYLYTGMRTTECRKLGEGVITEVGIVRINDFGLFIDMPNNFMSIRRTETLNEFARADGFTDWFDMVDWFKNQHGIPFEGILVKWEMRECGT